MKNIIIWESQSTWLGTNISFSKSKALEIPKTFSNLTRFSLKYLRNKK